MMKLRPLGNRVLVKPEAEEYKGMIILPDSAKEKPTRGVVLAVGPGQMDDNGKIHKPEVAEGAQVLFGKYAGNEIQIDGQTLYIMRETDIYCEIVGEASASVKGYGE
jgi:chaperonin GroES